MESYDDTRVVQGQVHTHASTVDSKSAKRSLASKFYK